MYKFRVKYLYFKRIIPLIVIIILIPIVFFSTKKVDNINYSTKEVAKSNPKVTYIKDNKLYYINNDGKSIFLCDNVYKNTIKDENESNWRSRYFNHPPCIFLDEKNSVYFYGDIDMKNGVGTLYKYTENEGSIKINDNVAPNIEISPDHNKLAYRKVTNVDNYSCDLHIYEFDKKDKNILENANFEYVMYYGWDSDSVAWVENQGDNKLYIKNVNNIKKLVDSSKNIINIMKYSVDGKLLAYYKTSKDEDLIDIYLKDIDGATEKISYISDYNPMFKDFSFFYIGEYDEGKNKGNLYYKQLNKKAIKIASGVQKLIGTFNNSEKVETMLFQKFNGSSYITSGKDNPLKGENYVNGDKLFFNSSNKSFINIHDLDGEIKRASLNKSKEGYNFDVIDKNAKYVEGNSNYETNDTIFYTKKDNNNLKNFYFINGITGDKENIQNSIGEINTQGNITTGYEKNIDITYNNSPVLVNGSVYYCNLEDNRVNLYKKQLEKDTKKIAEAIMGFVCYRDDTVYYCTYAEDKMFDIYSYKADGTKEHVALGIDEVFIEN